MLSSADDKEIVPAVKIKSEIRSGKVEKLQNLLFTETPLIRTNVEFILNTNCILT